MKKALLFFGLFLASLYASDMQSGTDIVARTINFLIFAAILWYLVGGKVKSFFENRKNEIANRFQEVEKILEESKRRKEELELKLKEVKTQAEDIINTAKKEAELISNQIKASTEEEIKNMQKHFEEYKENEIRKVKRETVKEFLEETLKDIHISSDDAAKIVLKKVS